MRIFALVVLLAASVLAVAEDVIVRIQPPDGGEILTFYAETATTAEQRRQGLSGRQFLPHERGMLFEFTPPNANVCMWMKDTHIPLAALFANNNNIIVTVAFMQPQSTAHHCATVPIKYVFEITEEMGRAIKTGSRLSIIE